MPLDAASHLASQGWGGAGKPLRTGPNALARPLVGVQKKTLGGVGKDRDEAFAFWDHVYAVSAQSIKIKLHNDSDTDEEEEGEGEQPAPTTTGSASTSPPPPQLDRTCTGLISNRRPTGSQTPISTSTSTSTSGSSAPLSSESSSPAGTSPRVSVLAAAKKQAARMELYRRFYVGPVIGSDVEGERASSSKDIANELALAQFVEVEVASSDSSSTIVADELDAEAERKTAKAARKAAKEAKRQRKEEKRRRKAEKAALKEKGAKRAKEKQKSRAEEAPSLESSSEVQSSKTTKKRKREDDEDEISGSTDTKGRTVSPGKKKKKVKLIMSDPPPTIKYTPSLKPCDKKGILRTSGADLSKEQSGSDGEKSKKVTFTKTVISHTVARWWEEAGWSDDGI